MEQPIEPSTQQSAPSERSSPEGTTPAEQPPVEMSMEEFSRYRQEHPEAKVEVQSVRYNDEPIWQPGQPSLASEALHRKLSSIDQEKQTLESMEDLAERLDQT